MGLEGGGGGDGGAGVTNGNRLSAQLIIPIEKSKLHFLRSRIEENHLWRPRPWLYEK